MQCCEAYIVLHHKRMQARHPNERMSHESQETSPCQPLVSLLCACLDDGPADIPPAHMPRVCRAVFKRGVGVSVLAEYLKEANKQVEVWLQVRQGDYADWRPL
jgi:hypothetical protein